VEIYCIKHVIVILQIAGETLPYNNLEEIRRRLTEVSPNLTRYGDVEKANFFSLAQQLIQVMFDHNLQFKPRDCIMYTAY